MLALFSPYILLFEANNSRHPSLQVESHRWGTTAIVVKTKRERWGLRPPVTWERQGPIHTFATHTRGPLQMTQRQAGKRTMRCCGRRTTEEWPSFVIPLICQFSPGLLEMIGATCIRDGWATGFKRVTFLLWDITCGTTSWVISDAILNAMQTMFMLKAISHLISIQLN